MACMAARQLPVMPRNAPRPEDFNAFGYDPRGVVANHAALLFGENWRPDPAAVRHYQALPPAPPRYGPPADYQLPALPPDWRPNYPYNGYYGAVHFPPPAPIGPWGPPRHPVPPPYPMPPPAAPPAPAPAPRPAALLPPPVAPPAEDAAMREPAAARSKRKGKKEFSSFKALVHRLEEKHEITFGVDIEWQDFYDRLVANLDLRRDDARIGYKFSNAPQREKPTVLSSPDQLRTILERLENHNTNANTRTDLTIHVYDLARPTGGSSKAVAKSHKRGREADIPDELQPYAKDVDLDVAATKFIELKAKYKCGCAQSQAKPYCLVRNSGGPEKHTPFGNKEASFWAKEWALGNADLYNLPNNLALDYRPAKRGVSGPNKAAATPEIHIHNHFDGLMPISQASSSPSIEQLRSSSSSESLHHALGALDTVHPGEGFSSMAKPLQHAGVERLEDIAAVDVAALAEVTGLPERQVSSLVQQVIAQITPWRKQDTQLAALSQRDECSTAATMPATDPRAPLTQGDKDGSADGSHASPADKPDVSEVRVEAISDLQDDGDEDTEDAEDDDAEDIDAENVGAEDVDAEDEEIDELAGDD